MLDRLEARRLLSSVLSHGVLTVTGDDNANTIAVTLSLNKFKVSESGWPVQYFQASSVASIVVLGNGGKDSISIGSTVARQCTLKGGGGNDTITGSTQGDLIEGNSGNDLLKGASGNDALNGGSGNDTLEGDAGSDYLNGNGGNDAASYTERSAASPVTASIVVMIDGELSGGGGASGETDTFTGISALLGGAGNDAFSVKGGAELSSDVASTTLLLDGASGNDTLKMGETFAEAYPLATLKGGEGNDKLYDYTLASNKAYGDSGNDKYIIQAEGGSYNRFDGGSGNDTLDGGGMLIGHSGIVMPSHLESVTNYGDVGSVTGNSLNNVINVSGLAMTIHGGAGNDLIYGDSQDDSILGESGNDTLYGGAGYDRLDGGNGDDQLYGGDGNDKLIGGSGKDQLFGGAGKDTLVGNDGEKDSLYGGSGTDKAYKDSIDVLSSIETILT